MVLHYYSLLDNPIDDNQNNQSDNECFVYDPVEKVADYSNLRVTDLPTCQRLYPPQPAVVSKELQMQNLREKLLRKVKEYSEKRCNKNGFVKKGNISNAEFEGLKEIKENENIIVFSTEKSAKLIQNIEKNFPQHSLV